MVKSTISTLVVSAVLLFSAGSAQAATHGSTHKSQGATLSKNNAVVGKFLSPNAGKKVKWAKPRPFRLKGPFLTPSLIEPPRSPYFTPDGHMEAPALPYVEAK